jgi:hypothetical protein
VNLSTIIQNLAAVLEAEASSIANGNILITATGDSTVYNGLHIPYYETVLNNLALTGEVPIAKFLIDSLQQYLGSNSTLISGILGPANGTGSLTGILGGLSKTDSSATALLSMLKL